LRRRSWYTRDLPRRQKRRRGPVLLIGFGLAACLVAIVLFATVAGSDPSDSSENVAMPTQLALDGEDNQSAPSATAVSSTATGLPSSPTDGFGLVLAMRGYPFIWPANGRLTAGTGPSQPGIEIALVDSTIVAAARGIVTQVEAQGESGIEIIIDHENGLQTSYAPVDRALVDPGDVVRQGEPIGLGVIANGSVGLLHLEVTIEGSQVDPLDVLPPQGASDPDPVRLDCADEVIVIDSGAPLVLDFSETLAPDSVVARASVLSQTGGTSPNIPEAWASVSGAASVLFETLPSAINSGGYPFTLIVETRGGGERERVTCTVGVRTRTVEVSPFFQPPTPLPQSQPTGPTTSSVTPTRIPVIAPTQVPAQVPTNTPVLTPPTPTKTPFAG
jgi:Peptidase family M23